MDDINQIIEENRRRNRRNRQRQVHPDTGLGCSGSRSKVEIAGRGVLFLPDSMTEDCRFRADMDWNALCRLRFLHDFEYWAFTCVQIKEKGGSHLVPFILNSAQRKVLRVLEKMRLGNEPMRIIILKARQWGCSTFVTAYMAWIQIVHCRYWNSITCAHCKDTANVLKGMYENIVVNYPLDWWDEDVKPHISPVGGSRNLFKVAGRDCTYMNTSSVTQNGGRGLDISMAHLSEVAYWRATTVTRPEYAIQSICSSITLDPMTFLAIESTANGVGNYFHSEWMRAAAGLSDKTPVFVAWYEIEIYVHEVDDVQKFWDDMDDYERALWDDGLTLEQICWYHTKRKEYNTHVAMMAEYPSDAVEAFNATNNAVFSPEAIDDLRRGCCPPLMVGELQGNALVGPLSLQNIHFVPDSKGKLKVWKTPDSDGFELNRYVAAVDIGGRSEMSDFSVIAVFDRKNPDYPELVAQWRGHVDHDILAWKAAMIATWYCRAKLIIESNTLETDRTEGDHGEFILHELERHYPRLYCREGGRPGFHTNRATKTRIINSLIGVIRERGYLERDEAALNEASCYEKLPHGGFGAKSGKNDDLVITRALALSYCNDLRMRQLRLNDGQPKELMQSAFRRYYSLSGNSTCPLDYSSSTSSIRCSKSSENVLSEPSEPEPKQSHPRNFNRKVRVSEILKKRDKQKMNTNNSYHDFQEQHQEGQKHNPSDPRSLL